MQGFGEVIRDPHERVESGHRLLEHQADRGSAKASHLLRRGLHEVAPFEVDGPVPDGAHRQQAHNPATEGRLAAAGLADQAECLALLDLEAHPVDGAHRAPVRRVPHPEVPDAHDGVFRLDGHGGDLPDIFGHREPAMVRPAQ